MKCLELKRRREEGPDSKLHDRTLVRVSPVTASGGWPSLLVGPDPSGECDRTLLAGSDWSALVARGHMAICGGPNSAYGFGQARLDPV